MDPATLALIASALGAGLEAVFTILLERGVAEPVLKKRRDEAALLAAVKNALTQSTGSPDPNEWNRHRWTLALESIKANSNLAARVAATAIEMVRDEPSRVPPDLVKDLRLTEDQRQPFAAFLFNFRQKLATSGGYAEGIRYANDLHSLNRLDGLYELATAVVTQTETGKALRVQMVPTDTREQERAYLEYTMRKYGGLSLVGRSEREAVVGTNDESLRLEKVYIALNTNEVRRRKISESEPRGGILIGASDKLSGQGVLSALRAVMESRRLVLLGDPGSGKSTFAQHICLCLAGSRLNPLGEWPSRLAAGDLNRWTLPFYFPIFVRLRDFAAGNGSLPVDPKEMGQAKHLLGFIKKELSEGFSASLAEHAQMLLENGQALVFLDGLDEVRHPNPAGDSAKADSERRVKVAQVIDDFSLVRFPHSRVLVTCRAKQYPVAPDGRLSAPWALLGFPIATLADFDWDQVRKFSEHWFQELAERGRLKADPDKKCHAFLNALDTRSELAELAPKPIVLTQMALVHGHRELPGSRVGVYSECARLLLWDWESLRATQSGRRGETAEEFLKTLDVPNLRLSEVQNALDEAVFHTHEAGDSEISGDKLRRYLRETFEAYNLSEAEALRCAQEFIATWLRSRNGLIIPASGEDSFDVPHSSFREFMAGRFLRENTLPNVETGEPERWDHSGPRLAEADPNKWQEVFRFAAGLATSTEVATALNVLLSEQLSPEPHELGKVFLAAEITRDAGPASLRHPRNSVGRRVYAHLKRQLICLMRDTRADRDDYPHDHPKNPPTALNILAPRTRLVAGNLLESLDWVPSDLHDFLPISSETPIHINRSVPFYAAKYPVTNLQYKQFVQAEDYADPEIWKNVLGFDSSGQPEDLSRSALEWFQRVSNDDPDIQPPGEYFDFVPPTSQEDMESNENDIDWDDEDDSWMDQDIEAGSEFHFSQAAEYMRSYQDPQFGASHPLHPVVGVTWHEAAAYCVWLMCHWLELDEGRKNLGAIFRGKFTLRLPSEIEWAAAAGGTAHLRFPWQEIPSWGMKTEEILPCTNTMEANLHSTTPVCMYPAGASPKGVMDMAGNIWEWQANLYPHYFPDRALRGGSWGNEMNFARAAARGHSSPESSSLHVGFRVFAFPT